MDAFESIVGRIMEKKGYWIRQSVKIKFSTKEKSDYGNPSMPTPEIDLVALKGNECILFEVKSFLDSKGVRLANLISSPGYKILNDKKFRSLVESKIRIEFELPSTTSIRYGLAAGNIFKPELQGVVDHCHSNNIFLLSPREIADALVKLGEDVYINDEVTMTIKMLRNEHRLK
jgi:hypothetical protein